MWEGTGGAELFAEKGRTGTVHFRRQHPLPAPPSEHLPAARAGGQCYDPVCPVGTPGWWGEVTGPR